MSSQARQDRRDTALRTEITTLSAQLAELAGQIAALRKEKDYLAELTDVRERLETLKIEKARKEEDQARLIRETEHKTGLLRTKMDQDIAHATREAKLAVREENLAADRDRFKAEMDFQREHLQREVDRVQDILGQVLARLPDVNAQLRITAPARPAGKPAAGG